MGEIREAGLDPLTVPDISVPYSLERISGSCVPILTESESPVGRILGGILACIANTVKMEGDLTLQEGLMSGLAGLARSQPTEISVSDGVARLGTTLSVLGLQCPFTVINSNADIEIPKMEAGVGEISVKLGVDIPLTGETSAAGNMDFTPILEELPVELDMDLGELGPLEKIIRPLVVDPVRKRLVTALRDEVTKILKEKFKKIGLSSLLQ